MLEQIQEILNDLLTFNAQSIARWITALIFILVLALIRMGLLRLVEQRVDDLQTRHQWRRGISYTVLILGAIISLSLVVSELQSLITVLGIIGAGLAVVLRDPIVNLIGWVFIISTRPFEIGDRVQLGPNKGDVIDIQFFEIVMLEIGEWVDAEQSTGRIMHVPNQRVFTHALSNYHKGMGYIWNEIHMTLTFESNWRKAKDLIYAVAEEYQQPIGEAARNSIRDAQHRYPIMYAHLEPAVFVQVEAYGTKLTLRYLSNPRARRGSEHHLWQHILAIVEQNADIEFAYPTTRFYQPS